MPQGVDFMFGYIEIQTNEKPRSCVKTILNAARRFYGKTDVAIRESEVCGLHLYRCGVTFPYGCTDVHRQRCLENAARKLYHAFGISSSVR